MEENIAKYKYLPLTPKELDPKDANVVILKEKVEDKSIKNIALMAPYGAGKSSVLTSFEKSYGKDKCIGVSLASFNNDEENSVNGDQVGANINEEKTINDIDNKIEKSILQQILYKKEKKDLPQSKIKRIGRLSVKQIILISICVLFGVLSVASGVLFSLQITGITVFKICTKIYFLFSLICALFCICGLVLGRKISRLSFNDIDIGFSDNEKESLLNRFLNEIIYFFQKTNYNVVIFEDIDRFNNLDIFVKLRELNILLNNNDVISKKHKITFIYAINNNIFRKHTERTKFFDFIIPLVPVLSPLNVKDDLIESLSKSGLGSQWLTAEFIYDISQYIKDKRVLNSIINDCITMVRNLDLSKIPGDSLIKKQVQLFALMAYKNICPRNFADLENGKGELIQCINLARSFSKEQVKELDAKISEKRALIKRIEELPYKSLDQIISMIKGYLCTHSQGYRSGHFNIDTIKEIPDDKTEMLVCYIHGDWYSARIAQIEQDLGIDSLKHLWEDAKLKENNEISKCNIEIQKLLNEKISLTQDGFACLLLHSEKVFAQIKPTELLQMLVVNKYVSEYYKDFMGKSGEEFLSSNDRLFVKMVLENREPDFELTLTSPQLILRDLSDKKFERKAMLNRNIIDTVFSDISISSIQRQRFYGLILTDDRVVNASIIQYFVQSSDWNISFVQYLVNHRTDLIDLLKKHIVNSNLLGTVLKYLLKNIDADSLTKQNNTEIYQEILASDVSVISMLLNDTPKLAFLGNCKFKLDCITSCEDIETLILIEKYNLWRITTENLFHILRVVYNNTDDAALCKGLTLIKNTKYGAIDYIQNNLTNYVSNVLLCQPEIDMEEADVLDIIQNENLDLTTRLQVVHKLKSPIEFNSYIDIQVVKELLVVDKIILNCEEIVKVMSADEQLKELLCDYLFNHKDKIKLQFQVLEPLAYLIANSNKTYQDGSRSVTLYDIYKENLVTVDWKIIKLDNDEIIEQIVLTHNSFMLESMKRIVQGNYPRSLKALVKKCFDSLETNGLINYNAAFCYYIEGDNKEKKESSIIMDNLLGVNNYEDAKKLFDQTANENIRLTKELRERLVSLGIDPAELFATQIEFMSQEEALLWAQDINPELAQLRTEGSINGTIELNDDVVVQALLKMNYAHRCGNGLRRYKIEVS